MTEVTMSENWGHLAMHDVEHRIWTRVGEGMELSVVGRDPGSGATAMFQRITKTEAPELEAKPHTHAVVCQTLVMSGVVEMTFQSDTRALKAGDYLRVPAGIPHVQRVVSDKAELFVITEGNPGIEFVVPERWSRK